MATAFNGLAVGSQVQVDAIASWAGDRPGEEQVRLATIVGEVRTVIEYDRYGFVWLSWTSDGRTADFCVRPDEVSVISGSLSHRREPARPSIWKQLEKTRVDFGPTTAIVLFAFVGCVIVGLMMFARDRGLGLPSGAMVLAQFFAPLSLLAASAVTAVYWIRQRKWQYGVEFCC